MTNSRAVLPEPLPSPQPRRHVDPVYVSPIAGLPGRVLPGLWIADTVPGDTPVEVIRVSVVPVTEAPLVDALADHFLARVPSAVDSLIAVHSSGTSFDLIVTPDFEISSVRMPAPAGADQPTPSAPRISYLHLPALPSGSRRPEELVESTLRIFSRDTITDPASRALLELLHELRFAASPGDEYHLPLHAYLLNCEFFGIDATDDPRAAPPTELVVSAQLHCCYSPIRDLARFLAHAVGADDTVDWFASPAANGLDPWEIHEELSYVLEGLSGAEPIDMLPSEIEHRELFKALSRRSGVDAYQALTASEVLVGD